MVKPKYIKTKFLKDWNKHKAGEIILWNYKEGWLEQLKENPDVMKILALLDRNENEINAAPKPKKIRPLQDPIKKILKQELKEQEIENYKEGEIAEASKKSAVSAVNNGYAELIEEPKKTRKTNSEARYYSDKSTFENPDFRSYCMKNFGRLPDRLSESGLKYYRVLQKNYLRWFKEQEEVEIDGEEVDKNNEEDNQISMIKIQVLEKFGAKKFGQASEILVEYLLKREFFYTTRNDIKPEIWYYDNGIYLPEGRSFVKEILRKIMGEAYSNFVYKIVIDKLEADTFIDSEEFFKNDYPNEIPLQNGILNIFTKELKPFTPEKIFFNKLPVTYNKKCDCPEIKRFLSEILATPEDSQVIFELIGFCLLKEYRFEKAFMFVGIGRNGKSKLLGLIKRLLGAENCAGIPLTQLKSESTGVRELHNRLVNLAGDLSYTDLKDSGMFKQLTGRDLITAKRKYLRDLIFENYAKLIFSCNELPRVYDTSKGFWSRWVLLEFPYQFIPEYEFNKLPSVERKNKRVENPNILDLISTPEELSGLLNVSLEAFQKLIKSKKFSYTRGSAEIKETWIRNSNSFMAFCLDCLTESPESFIRKKDLRLVFSKYCKFHKLRGAGDKDIKATLGDLFGVFENRKMINNELEHVWEGVKFQLARVTTFFPKTTSYIYIGGFHEKPWKP